MGGLLGALFLLVARYDPARPYARALRSLVAGLFLLMAWNALSLPCLGVNPLSMWLTGSLGLTSAAITTSAKSASAATTLIKLIFFCRF